MTLCSFCNKKAVITKKYEGISLCKNHFLYSVEKKLRKTIRQNQLIKRDDCISIAISGGKDSTLLLWFLASIQKKYKIKIFAISIDEGIKNYRKNTLKYAKQFCKKYNIKHYLFSFKKEIGMNLDKIMKTKYTKNQNIAACSVCAVIRRYILNKKARELGANKLAVGHNLDDESQSIFINYIRGDVKRGMRLGPISPNQNNVNFVPRIKPLINIPEKEIALFCVLKNFEFSLNDECPYARTSFRWKIRDIILDLEQNSPGTRFSIIKNFEKTRKILELKNSKKEKINFCKICGEASGKEYCKFCLIKKTLAMAKVKLIC